MHQSREKLVTRFAPSPTGFLHIGHVLHMLYVWKLAAQFNAEIICRMEDHDRNRWLLEYETNIVDDMLWLGFKPHRGFGTADPLENFRQSDCHHIYQQFLEKLGDRVYACECSRREIIDAEKSGLQFFYCPRRCFEKKISFSGNALKLRVSDESVAFEDVNLGLQTQYPARDCGDFSLRDRDGQWTYQFACVCDDIRQGVNLIIRGQDILESTGRQILLWNLLTDRHLPLYFHHPLILDANGQKISKRQFPQSISEQRQKGATPGQIIRQAIFQAGDFFA